MTDPLRLPTGTRLTAPPLVRLAGLPASVLDRLRCTESAKRSEAIVHLEQWLHAEGEQLADALYPVIGTPEAVPCKAELVGLRRALHRMRRPAAREWSARVAAVLPADLAGRVDGWLTELAALERQRAELPEVLATEIAATRHELREVAAHPGFRRALSQAAPALHAELDKWLRDERRRPRQQTQVRLMKYLARAAAKTSPYSTFTVSGAAAWTGDGPAVRRAGPERVTGVLELNGMLVQHILTALGAEPRLRDRLPLRVNPSAVAEQGRITFLGRPPKESIVTLPDNPTVRECLRFVRESPEPTAQRLRQRLDPAAEPGGKADRFVTSLLNSGLLEPVAPVADQDPDPLAGAASWLAGCGLTDLADVPALLHRVRTELRRDVPVADVAAHLDRQRALGAAVDDVAVRVGVPAESLARMGNKGIFHENAVLTAPAAHLALPRWRPALTDLDTVRTWLAALDPALALRLTIGSYLAERFGHGARVPLLTLHRAVQEELVSRSGSAAARELVALLEAPPLLPVPLAGSPLPRLRELDRIRRQAKEFLLDHPTGNGVARVDPARLAELSAQWPAWVTPPRSLGCYLQVFGDRLVVNAVHTGYGRARTRLAHLIGLAGGTVGTDSEVTTEPMPVELCGRFATSLNLRVPGTRYEIDYPFTTSDRPAGERIALTDLTVVHNARTGLARLTCPALGHDVLPLHLGMMADLLLPPVARLLTEAFGASFYAYPSTLLLPAGTDLPELTGIAVRPRIEVGRVVLRRARWVAPAGLVPVRAPADTDADYLLRLTGWLARNGMPTRCFVRFWPTDGYLGEPGSGPNVLDKSRKPVYVDFANWYLVTMFERMLGAAGSLVVFEEALPDPTAEPHGAAEFLVELTAEGDHG